MTCSETNDPIACKFAQTFIKEKQRKLIWFKEKDCFKDCACEMCKNKDEDHQQAVAFIWMASDFVKEDQHEEKRSSKKCDRSILSNCGQEGHEKPGFDVKFCGF